MHSCAASTFLMEFQGGHPGSFSGCSCPYSAVHLLGGLLLLHSSPGRCGQRVRPLEGSRGLTSPLLSVSFLPLCCSREAETALPCSHENQRRFLPGLRRNPGCSFGTGSEATLSPLSLCFHQPEVLSGSREEVWAPCFDLQGSTNGKIQRSSLIRHPF